MTAKILGLGLMHLQLKHLHRIVDEIHSITAIFLSTIRNNGDNRSYYSTTAVCTYNSSIALFPELDPAQYSIVQQPAPLPSPKMTEPFSHGPQN